MTPILLGDVMAALHGGDASVLLRAPIRVPSRRGRAAQSTRGDAGLTPEGQQTKYVSHKRARRHENRRRPSCQVQRRYALALPSVAVAFETTRTTEDDLNPDRAASNLSGMEARPALRRARTGQQRERRLWLVALDADASNSCQARMSASAVTMRISQR